MPSAKSKRNMCGGGKKPHKPKAPPVPAKSAAKPVSVSGSSSGGDFYQVPFAAAFDNKIGGKENLVTDQGDLENRRVRMESERKDSERSNRSDRSGISNGTPYTTPRKAECGPRLLKTPQQQFRSEVKQVISLPEPRHDAKVHAKRDVIKGDTSGGNKNWPFRGPVSKSSVIHSNNGAKNPASIEPAHHDEKKVEVKKVLTFPPSKIMKHPLLHSWTLWYFCNDKTQSWEQNQRQILTVQFVEDFWALYTHIVKPSELKSGCDYSLFRSGIKPMWEDESNMNGGRWLINHDKRIRLDLDERWLEIMLFLIGETMDEEKYGRYVNGAVVNVRTKSDKISVWLKVTDRDITREIGVAIKRVLGMVELIQFETHADTQVKAGSTGRPTLKI